MQGAGAAFTVGLAFWPGGRLEDWGDPLNGYHPCNLKHRADLVRGERRRAALLPLSRRSGPTAGITSRARP